MVADRNKPTYEQLQERVNSLETELALLRAATSAASRFMGESDVTAYKAAQTSLRESEQKFRSLAEESPTMIFINCEGRIVYANQLCEKILGYTRNEFYDPDFNFLNLIAPACRDVIRSNFNRHKRGEDIEPYEYTLIAKNGKLIDSIINTKLLNYQGKPAILGIVTDITERKRLETDLSKNEERYRLISELTSDFSYCLQVHENDQCTVEWVAGAIVTITGYTAEEIQQNSDVWASLVVEDDIGVAKVHRENILQGKSGVAEFRIENKNGHVRWIRDYSRAELTTDGKGVTRIFGAVQDITERKKAEEEKEKIEGQLRHSQKMEAIGRLAGGVAHDFNNLLTTITGYSDLLIKEIPAENPIRNDIAEIHKAGQRAAALTRQLLTFSRNQPHAPQVLDLNALVIDVQKMLKPIIGEDILLELETASDISRIKGEAGQLEQVLLNLAVNARDAMPKGGRISITTRNVLIDSYHARVFPQARPGKFVCLSIRDTGSGIPLDVRPHIFEPFFTTKEENKGTGLGLSIVYGIVNQHGGWINLYSEVGRGTEFKIYLPAYSTSSPVPIEVAPRSSLMKLKGDGQRVLLVEDEQSVLLFAQRLLTDNGYTIYAASNAQEACEIFSREQGHIDLLFTDIVLPDIPGPQLYNRLLRTSPQLKAILTSGYSDERYECPAALANSYTFLQKPYLVEDLLRTIKQMFS